MMTAQTIGDSAPAQQDRSDTDQQQETNQQQHTQQQTNPDSLLSNTCLELALEGERLIKAGDFKNGVTFLEEAIKVGTNDEGQLSAICSQLGNAYFLLEDYQKALSYHKKDVDILHRIGDEEAEAKACGNLGNTFKMLGKFDEATWYCKRHLEITRKLQDEIGESKALYNLGNIYHVKGKRMINATGQEPGELSNDMRSSLQEAIVYYEKNLAVVTKLNDFVAMGRAYGNLGNTHYMLGNFDLAVESHKKRLELAKQTNDKSAQRRAHLNLGNANVFLEKYTQAIENYSATLKLSQELEDICTEAHSCYSLANTYAILKDYQSAIKFHLRHLDLAHGLDDKLGEGQSCCMLVKIYEKVNDLEAALKFAKRHYEIAEQLGDKEGLATALSNIKVFEETLSQRQAFQASLSMSKQHQHRQDSLAGSSSAKNHSSASAAARGSISSSSSSSTTNKKSVSGLEQHQQQSHRSSKAAAFDIHRLSPDKRQEKDLRKFKKQLNSDLTGVVRSTSSERLFDMIAHFQSGRIDDQRCEIFQRPIPAGKTAPSHHHHHHHKRSSSKTLAGAASEAGDQGFRSSSISVDINNKENMNSRTKQHTIADGSSNDIVDTTTKDDDGNNNDNGTTGKMFTSRTSQQSIVNPINAVSAAASAIKSTYRKASLAYPMTTSNTLSASIQAQRRPTVSAEHREQLFDLIAGAQGQRMDEQRASLPALTLANGLLKNPTSAGLLSHRDQTLLAAKRSQQQQRQQQEIIDEEKPFNLIAGRPKERSQSIMHPSPAAAAADAAAADARAKPRTVDDDARLFNKPRAHKLNRHFQTVDTDLQVHGDKFLDSLMKYQSTRFNDQRSEFPKKPITLDNTATGATTASATATATNTATSHSKPTSQTEKETNNHSHNGNKFKFGTSIGLATKDISAIMASFCTMTVLIAAILIIQSSRSADARIITIYHKYIPSDSENSNTTSHNSALLDSPLSKALQAAASDISNDQQSTGSSSLEYNSPLKRIVELISGHRQSVIVLTPSSSKSSNSSPNSHQTNAMQGVDHNNNIAKSSEHQAFTSMLPMAMGLPSLTHQYLQAAQQSSGLISPVPSIGDSSNQQSIQPPASSSSDRTWTDTGGNIGLIQPLQQLAAQQQLIQSTVPYDHYYISPQQSFTDSAGNQISVLQPSGFLPQLAFQQQQQQSHPSQTYGPMQTQQSGNINQQQSSLEQDERAQPVFLSSYVPEVPQLHSAHYPGPVPSTPSQTPNSIQQIQESQKSEPSSNSGDSLTTGDNEDNSGGDSNESKPQDSEESSNRQSKGNTPESGSSSYEDHYDSDKDEAPNQSKPETLVKYRADPSAVTNGLVTVGLNDDCLQCICRASSGCDHLLRCITRGADENHCGPFQLTEDYWQKAGSPGDAASNFQSFEDCANDVDCAVETVTNYMKKYYRDCDGDENITCMDYARLHRLKPDECDNAEKLANEYDAYWAKFQRCAESYNRSRNGDDEDI